MEALGSGKKKYRFLNGSETATQQITKKYVTKNKQQTGQSSLRKEGKMKKMKKLFAVLLTLAMVMGMTTMGMAEPTVPQAPTATVTVQNVVKGATLKAYQIVRYNANGKFENIVTGKPSNLEVPAASEITELAAQAGTAALPEKTGLTWTPASEEAATTNYTTALEAGMWLILISGTNQTIYNPMIVSVNVGTDANGTLTGGSVDASGNFVAGGVNAYAKSSKPDVEKTTANNNFQLDDKIPFTIKAQIPAYQDNYKEVKYVITDTLSNNLEFVANSVKVYLQPAKDSEEADRTELTVTPSINGTKMTIDVSETANAKGAGDQAKAYINGGKYIVVEYQAQLTEEAKKNLDQAVNLTTNNVKVDYTNDPTNKDSVTSQEKETEQYTFGINAKANGTDTTITENFKKTDDGVVKEGETEKTYTPLANAEFAIYTKNQDGTYTKVDSIATGVTGENGIAAFTGLKANTDYYLHEEKAPAGYQLRDEYIKVLIEATFDQTTGKLTGGPTIIIGEGDEQTSTEYTWTNEGGVTVKTDTSEDTFEFHNTKLAGLPSTGGIGTTIFTIGGCLIMILAAAMFFASRRRSAK